MGTLHDLVVLTESGRVVGAVVAHAGAFGVDVLSVVPWAALRFGRTSDRVVLLPHIATASQPAELLGDRGDDRYRRFLAVAGAELGRGDRRPMLRPVVGVGVAAVALMVLAPAALAVGLVALGALLAGASVGRDATAGLVPSERSDGPPAPASLQAPAGGSRVIDVEFEVVGGPAEAAACARRPGREPARPAAARRVQVLRVVEGGPADGGRIGALGLGPVGGRVLGWWRGDCYIAQPAAADRLAGGDLVAVVLWLDPAGDALGHLHRAGLRPA